MTKTATRADLIEALADAAYHAAQLLATLGRIDPDDADLIGDREHRATALSLAKSLSDIEDHPAVAFLPDIP